MTRLLDLCSLIRSKNAGPFWLTPLVDLKIPTGRAALDRHAIMTHILES